MFKENPKDRTIDGRGCDRRSSGGLESRRPNLVSVTIREEELSLYQSAVTNSPTYSLRETSKNLPSGIPVGEGHISVVIENHSTNDRSFTLFWNVLGELRDQGQS